MGPLDQVLPAHPVLSQHIKLASELDTPEAIFDKVKQQLPAGAQLASGGLLDARGLSDVDISVHDPEALDDYYSIEGYDRPINVKVSPDENVSDNPTDSAITTLYSATDETISDNVMSSDSSTEKT